MNIRASGRSALILATGLFVCFAGPSQAAAGADDATANSKSENAARAPLAAKNLRHAHHRKSTTHGKLALKPAADKNAAATVADDSATVSAIPPWVANANAQLPSPDTPAGNARAMSARANGILQTDSPVADGTAGNATQLVAADQLNDVDRALREGNPPAANVVLASADPPAAPVTAGSSHESSTWDETSLIGKIFIGFGALLTMASAARMFMA
jgi:hypothetical protein